MNKEKKKQEQRIKKDEMELRENSKELSELKKLSRKNTGNKKDGKSFIKKDGFLFLLSLRKRKRCRIQFPIKEC